MQIDESQVREAELHDEDTRAPPRRDASPEPNAFEKQLQDSQAGIVSEIQHRAGGEGLVGSNDEHVRGVFLEPVRNGSDAHLMAVLIELCDESVEKGHGLAIALQH